MSDGMGQLGTGIVSFVSAGSAACLAEFGSLPFDTAKVRMQVQGQGGVPVRYRNIWDCMRTVAIEEGAGALYKGLAPGLQRQMVRGVMSFVGPPHCTTGPDTSVSGVSGGIAGPDTGGHASVPL